MDSRTFIAWIIILVLLLGLVSIEASTPQRRSMVVVVFALVAAGAVLSLSSALILGGVMAIVFAGTLAIDWQYGVVTSGDILTLAMVATAPIFLSRLRSLLDAGDVFSWSKKKRTR